MWPCSLPFKPLLWIVIRVIMTDLRSARLLSPPHSARSSSKQRSPRPGQFLSILSHSDPEALSLPSEIRLLRLQLAAAGQEMQTLKERYVHEVGGLRETIGELRREVDLMRFERDEAVAKEGEADITKVASQVISMRTEIDRISAFLWKSQRETAISRKCVSKRRL